VERLADAERLFKLAVAVHAACTVTDSNAFDYLEAFSFGRHVARRGELALSPDEEKTAAAALEHCATYLLAVQLDTVLQQSVEDRFHHPDDATRSAAWIARLLRNAFAHDPLRPIWQTYPECDDAFYEVAGIIALRTAGLDGKRVESGYVGWVRIVYGVSAAPKSPMEDGFRLIVVPDSGEVAISDPPLYGESLKNEYYNATPGGREPAPAEGGGFSVMGNREPAHKYFFVGTREQAARYRPSVPGAPVVGRVHSAEVGQQ
jgi:hypothetical protein